MLVPGSSYWNIGIGREKGEVLKDEEGMKTMKVLGENIAWLLEKINSRSKKSDKQDTPVTESELKSEAKKKKKKKDKGKSDLTWKSGDNK